jgi:transposase
MEAVALQHPDRPIIVIWDNLNIHHEGKDARWTRFNERHGGRFQFVHTPIHASWLNQVELWFGKLQRRLIRRGVSQSLEDLDRQVLAFIAHHNALEARPYAWTFTGYPLREQAPAA